MTSVPEELLRSYSLPEPVEKYRWSDSRESFYRVGGITCRSLRNQLLIIEQELKLKGERKKRLEDVRTQLETEIDDLTANLFENANKMVVEANVKRMASETNLEQAQTKVAQLQADIVAMKTLLANNVSSTVNSSILTQMSTEGKSQTSGQPAPVKKKFSLTKNTFRRKSQHKASASSLGSSNCDGEKAAIANSAGSTVDSRVWKYSDVLEDSVGLEEFKLWKKSPEISEESPFIRRLVAEDVRPCLNFSSKETSEALLKDILQNVLSIEPLQTSQKRVCSLSNKEVICAYQIHVTANQHHLFVCQDSRDKIVTVCELFSYLRCIKQQLFSKQTDLELFEKIRHMRKNMVLQRLGFPLL